MLETLIGKFPELLITRKLVAEAPTATPRKSRIPDKPMTESAMNPTVGNTNGLWAGSLFVIRMVPKVSPTFVEVNCTAKLPCAPGANEAGGLVNNRNPGET